MAPFRAVGCTRPIGSRGRPERRPAYLVRTRLRSSVLHRREAGDRQVASGDPAEIAGLPARDVHLVQAGAAPPFVGAGDVADVVGAGDVEPGVEAEVEADRDGV